MANFHKLGVPTKYKVFNHRKSLRYGRKKTQKELRPLRNIKCYELGSKKLEIGGNIEHCGAHSNKLGVSGKHQVLLRLRKYKNVEYSI